MQALYSLASAAFLIICHHGSSTFHFRDLGDCEIDGIGEHDKECYAGC